MHCPACRQEHPATAAVCSRCGTPFTLRRPVHRAKPPRPTRTARSIVRTGALAGLALVGLGWYWFFFWAPGGLPVAQDAYRDRQNGFALVPPRGWTLSAPNRCITPAGGPAGGAAVCTVLELRGQAGPGQQASLLQVIKAPLTSLFSTGFGGFLVVHDSTRQRLAEKISRDLMPRMPGRFSPGASRVRAVDGLPSLLLTGTAAASAGGAQGEGALFALPPAPGSQPAASFSLSLALVPAGGTVYLIALTTAEAEQAAPVFESALDSFRVTQGRPSPFQQSGGLFGSIQGDAILGLLVGLTAALLKLLAP